MRRSIDESFQSMISKRYGVDFENTDLKKSLFEQLDECDRVQSTPKVSHKNLNESLNEANNHKKELCKKWGCSPEDFDEMCSKGACDSKEPIMETFGDGIKHLLNPLSPIIDNVKAFKQPKEESVSEDQQEVAPNDTEEIESENEEKKCSVEESLTENDIEKENIKSDDENASEAEESDDENTPDEDDFSDDIWERFPDDVKLALNQAWDEDKTNENFFDAYLSALVDAGIISESDKEAVIQSNIAYGYVEDAPIEEALNEVGNDAMNATAQALQAQNQKITANAQANKQAQSNIQAVQNYKNLASAAGETGDYKATGNLSTGNLKMGSSGDDVKALQTTLNNAGYKLDADGKFGAKTQTALKQYQADRGLTSDGIYGQQTAQAISNTNTSQATANKIKANIGNNTMGTDIDNQYKPTTSSTTTTSNTVNASKSNVPAARAAQQQAINNAKATSQDIQKTYGGGGAANMAKAKQSGSTTTNASGVQKAVQTNNWTNTSNAAKMSGATSPTGTNWAAGENPKKSTTYSNLLGKDMPS